MRHRRADGTPRSARFASHRRPCLGRRYGCQGDDFPLWTLGIGALLVTMALAGSLLKRLPVSASMLYLALGFGLGTAGWGLMTPDPRQVPDILERVAEVALLISLFSVGLKLGLPLSSRQWRLPVRLAFASMALTVGLIAAVALFLMGLPLGAAVLIGGILAPTDPADLRWNELAADIVFDSTGLFLIKQQEVQS